MEKQRRWIYKLLPRAFLPKPIEGDLTAAATAPVPVIVKGAAPLDGKQQGRAGDAMMELFKILVFFANCLLAADQTLFDHCVARTRFSEIALYTAQHKINALS